MALALSAVGAMVSNAVAGPISPVIPGSPVEGDIVHLHVFARDNSLTNPTIDTPSGWTLLRTGTVDETTVSLTASVFRRVVPSGGISNPSVSSPDADGGISAVCSLFTGGDPTTPEDATVPTANTGDSTSVTAPGITTVTAGAIVAHYFAQLDNTGMTSPNNSTTAMYSGVVGYTTTSGVDASMAAAHKVMASPAASGTTTITGGGSLQFIGISVAIRPLTDVAKAGSDTVTFGLTDTATITERTKAGSDTVNFGLTDNATVLTPVAKAGSDTITFGLTDNAAAPDKSTIKSGSDTVTFGLTDNASKLVDAPIYGTWVSPAKAIPDDPIVGSLIYWDATVPIGSWVRVETSVDNGASWQETTFMGPIPRLPIGSTSVKALMARVTMNRASAQDPSPQLHSIHARFARDSGEDVYCQLGRFFLEDTEVVDNGAGLVIRLAGADLSRRIALNTWDETLAIDEGTNSRDAIMMIILNRWPQATFNLPSTEWTTTRMFFGEGVGAGNPWADAKKVARDAGWELYLDAFGVVTARAVPDPELQPSVWTVTDDARPTMIDLSRRMTNRNTHNQVIVTGESSSNEVPVTARWRDMDPTSRTYWDGPYGHVTKTIRSDRVRTIEQAQAVADTEGLLVKGATEIARMSMIVCPFLEPSDVIEVDREHSKTTGRFAIDGWHIDLHPEALMTMDVRRQRQ